MLFFMCSGFEFTALHLHIKKHQNLFLKQIQPTINTVLTRHNNTIHNHYTPDAIKNESNMKV